MEHFRGAQRSRGSATPLVDLVFSNFSTVPSSHSFREVGNGTRYRTYWSAAAAAAAAAEAAAAAITTTNTA